MNVINVSKQVEQAVKNLPDENYMLGRMLMQPFRPANSGSRTLMSSIHIEQFMVLDDGEIPLIQTGFETEFGRNSTSYVVSDHNYRVLKKIYKFSFNKDHYYLILENLDNGEFDVVERITYKHNTERYGYLWDNRKIDCLSEGDIINTNDIIKTSNGYDEYGNKKNGTNLLTMYLASTQNMEDSVIISESAALKLQTNLIKSTSITINENDILLNLFGDNNNYKTFPDVGETTTEGIFCAIRRVENRDILFSLAQQHQKELLLSDIPKLINGKILDIDVYSNNPAKLRESRHNAQLFKYYQEKINFSKQVNDFVGSIAMNHKLSYQLSKLYAICRDTVMGRQYYKEKLFNNIIIEVTAAQPLYMEQGDKCADRYGGKGVTSIVLPDSLMPLLDDGRRIEIIKNQSTCYNRLNIGQLHEQSLSMISLRIIDAIKKYTKTGEMTFCDAFNMWYKFVSMVDIEQANYALTYVDPNNEDSCQVFINSVLEDDGIIISTPPFTTPVNIDTIKAIYDAFPWIKPFKVLMPMEDSNGNIRYVPSRRPLVAGKIYNFRLKQYAEEKFSATSLSAVNLKSLNTRSKSNKIFESMYTKTPIQFGFMETADLSHIGMQYVVMNLMLYSNSPQGRRLFEGLLTGSPYDINIKLDMDSRNRNAEIINALMKEMGIELVFVKRPKVKKRMMNNIMYKTVPLKDWKPDERILSFIGRDNLIPEMLAVANQHKGTKPLYRRLMTIGVDKSTGKRKYLTNVREIWEEYDRQLAEQGLDIEIRPLK